MNKYFGIEDEGKIKCKSFMISNKKEYISNNNNNLNKNNNINLNDQKEEIKMNLLDENNTNKKIYEKYLKRNKIETKEINILSQNNKILLNKNKTTMEDILLKKITKLVSPKTKNFPNESFKKEIQNLIRKNSKRNIDDNLSSRTNSFSQQTIISNNISNKKKSEVKNNFNYPKNFRIIINENSNFGKLNRTNEEKPKNLIKNTPNFLPISSEAYKKIFQSDKINPNFHKESTKEAKKKFSKSVSNFYKVKNLKTKNQSLSNLIYKNINETIEREYDNLIEEILVTNLNDENNFKKFLNFYNSPIFRNSPIKNVLEKKLKNSFIIDKIKDNNNKLKKLEEDKRKLFDFKNKVMNETFKNHNSKLTVFISVTK